MGGFTRNERDLIKGAIQNAKHTAVTDMLGLRFLSKADFKELGLDLDKLERRAEFQSHESDPGGMTVPFGRDKGKPISDIDDAALQWLADAVKKSVEDPEKAKFKKRNEELLTALRDEYKRRHSPAPAAKVTEDADPKTGEVKTAEPDKNGKKKTGGKKSEPDPRTQPGGEFDYGPQPWDKEPGSEG